MRVYKYGAKVLRKVARKVRDDFPTRDYTNSMYATMKKVGGVGLALPQVGESKRMFVIMFNDPVTGKKIRRVFINPTIEYLGEKISMKEGCLSIPGIEFEVLRHERVRVNYFTDRWEEKTEEFEGMAARVIQHEYDHLDGILFIDYLSEEELKKLGGLLNKISMKSVDAPLETTMPRFNSRSYSYGGSYGNTYNNTRYATTATTSFSHEPQNIAGDQEVRGEGDMEVSEDVVNDAQEAVNELTREDLLRLRREQLEATRAQLDDLTRSFGGESNERC